MKDPHVSSLERPLAYPNLTHSEHRRILKLERTLFFVLGAAAGFCLAVLVLYLAGAP